MYTFKPGVIWHMKSSGSREKKVGLVDFPALCFYRPFCGCFVPRYSGNVLIEADVRQDAKLVGHVLQVPLNLDLLAVGPGPPRVEVETEAEMGPKVEL